MQNMDMGGLVTAHNALNVRWVAACCRLFPSNLVAHHTCFHRRIRGGGCTLSSLRLATKDEILVLA
jgi:hypothetical protein